MAIEIHDYHVPMTVDDAIYYLQKQTDNFGLFLDLDRLAEYRLRFLLELKEAETPLKKECPVDKFTQTAIAKYLVEKVGVKPYKVMKDDKVSLDKNIRDALIRDADVSEDARHIVELYNKYYKASYMLSYMTQYLELPICNTPSYNGHRMVMAHPKWNRLNTGRISASEPSLQNIPKYMGDIITSPEGYVLWRVDSDQIEPRITYSWYIPDNLIKQIITAYGDAYAGIMHYTEMSDAEEEACRRDFSNFKKKEITAEFKEKRKNYKILTLAANYGSALASVPEDIGRAYKRKIVEHPLRLKREAEVKQQVAHGTETFFTAFGNPITPQETAKYKKYMQSWKGHVERCGINNPIQGTASDLMIFSVYEASKVIDKNPNTHIAFYKHDEACFYIKEDEFSKVKDQLSEITAYNVDGWIPITCEGTEGQLKSEVPSVLC